MFSVFFHGLQQATFALNAARRFRYTLDFKAKQKEEEAREFLRLTRDEPTPDSASLKRQLSRFRTSTHVLRVGDVYDVSFFFFYHNKADIPDSRAS